LLKNSRLSTIEHYKRQKFLRLSNRHSGLYSIISTQPRIFHVARNGNPFSQFTDLFEYLFENLKDQPAYFIYTWYWYAGKPEAIKTIAEIEGEHRQRYPKFDFFHLSPTSHQAQLFREAGLKTILCNSNSLVDERIYKPLPFIEKKYDAVYDARMVEWKRHYLASQIKNPAFIYYFIKIEDDPDYASRMQEQFSGAHFFNHTETGEYKILQASEINECLNASRTGLCLSAEEGAMYASIQYLLAGLPVVSTESLGGRDVFFDKRYVSIVEAEPEAIKRAVEELINRNIPADFIRQNTLEKMRLHRQNFIFLVQSIYEREGIERDFQSEWDKIFFNKLVKNQNHFQVIEQLKKAERF
jgi:glycosyltransferase involved in cell wall biosynthesis